MKRIRKKTEDKKYQQNPGRRKADREVMTEVTEGANKKQADSHSRNLKKYNSGRYWVPLTVGKKSGAEKCLKVSI